MSLEVGRLVARIDIEGTFEQKLASARTQMEAVAASAGKLDQAVGKAGQSGAKLSVPDAPKRKLDEAAAAATKLDTGLGKAASSADKATSAVTQMGTAATSAARAAESAELKLSATRSKSARDVASAEAALQAARSSSDPSKIAAAESKLGEVRARATASVIDAENRVTAARQRSTSESEKAAVSAAKLGDGLAQAGAKGKALSVSDQPRAKLSETASIADQVDAKLGKVGLSIGKIAGLAGGGIGLGAVLTKGWDRITAIDTAQGKLRGLGHEAQGVTDIMGSALDSVTGTAYGLGDAASIAANAVAAGIQPGKDLTKYLTMTADASAIAGVSLGEMGRILNQVQTGQSAYAGDLSQLADRGIPIYQWLAEEAGVAASEVKKMASTGQISSEMLFSAIQNNIGGAAQELGGTLVGSLANVGAAFGRLGAAAIDPFKDQILGAAAGVTEFAGSLAKIAGPLASTAASGLGAIASIVGKIPAPITGATAALIALQKTGLGPRMAGAASTAVGALRGFGESLEMSFSATGKSIHSNGLFATSLHGIKAAGGAAVGGLKSVVNMLGGPWMIGMAAAGFLIADFVSASQSAAEVQKKLAEASDSSAAAQTELAEALLRSNGAMDDQAAAAAQRIIQAELDKTRAVAEQSINVVNDLDSAIKRNSYSYNDWAYRVDNARTAMDRGAAAHEMAKLEMQAMGDAAKETGVSVDDFARIAQEGGPKWDNLRAALARTGDAGIAVSGNLEAGRAAVSKITEAATEAEIASTLLAEAFRVMADESATAEDKTNALKAALDALAGDTLTADQATGQFYETLSKLDGEIDKLSEGTGRFTRELEGGGIAFDMTTESGRNLHATMLEMRDAIATVRDTGAPMSEVMAEAEKRMGDLAAETGLTTQQLWELGERMGFIPDVIETAVSIEGAGEAAGQLAFVSQSLKDVEKGTIVEVQAVGDEALAFLQRVGWEAERIPGTQNIRVTAQTSEAQAQLQGTLTMARNLAAAGPNVNVESNADFVTYALGLTKDAVEALPGGHVEITDTTPENMDRLRALGIEVGAPKNGRVLINDADVDRARGRVSELNNIQTSSTHRVNVEFSNPNFRPTGGGSTGYADGGIRGPRPFAQGGFNVGGPLPEQAVIAAPQGPKGLVQWAENETQGEAFIPLAPSKRSRSRKIWAEVGRRLGVADGVDGDMLSFADGGIMAGGLINFAKGVEGAPYVWGGVNWGDCSGAVSALANYVSGKSPFGSRFATGSQREGLLSRGFVSGRGGPGDLKIGWYNGGPYGGHTSATLPNGVNFEMGGARGNGQYGGGAAGADDPQYTDHAYFPMERFADIDASLGEGAMGEIAKMLGTGNPDLPAAADNRTPRQKNIDAIVAEGQRRGMSDRDIQIALMTAEQESGIRVLNNPADAPSMGMAAEGTGYDGTSTGIFQQQNNGAWGTLEDRMDPTKSAGMFYDQLANVQNRDSLSLAAAAQKVQGSAHPDAYAKHEASAASALSESKSRLATMSAGGGAGGSGKGLPVYVTNMPAGGFSGGGGGGGGGGTSSGGDAGSIIKEGSIADVLMRAAGMDPVDMFGEPALTGKEKRFDDTKIFEKEGDIEAAKEQARIAKIKLDELKNKTNAKGERVAPSESALASAELRAQEAERKVEKLEHDLRELRLKSQQVREHNASIGVDVENYANGGFHGIENHSAHIAPQGSYRIFGESETGGEAYIPLASHKRARSTAVWMETGRRLGYGIGAGLNLVGSVLTGNGLDTGWGGPSLGDIGLDTNALKDTLQPGLNAEAEKAGQQVAAVLQAFLNDVQRGVNDTMRSADDQQRQLRQQYARAMI